MLDRLPTPETGRALFFAHIEKLRAEAISRGERGPTDVELAEFFGVSTGSFGGWRGGGRPDQAIWPLIEAWSRGAVPVRSWDTRKERERWIRRQAQIEALSIEAKASPSPHVRADA